MKSGNKKRKQERPGVAALTQRPQRSESREQEGFGLFTAAYGGLNGPSAHPSMKWEGATQGPEKMYWRLENP